MNVLHWAKLTVGRAQPADDHQRRYANLLQSVLSGLASKVVGLFVSFISVPLTIGYLGAERYGVWITIGTLLAWLQLADFGLGNGLTNALATAYGEGRKDHARHYVTTSLVMLTAVSLLIGALCVLAWPHIDWTGVFNVHTVEAEREVGPAAATALILFLVSFPLSLIPKIFIAYQEGRIANYWGAAGNLASLGALLLVTQTGGGLVWLVLAVSGTGLCMTTLSAIWLFLWHKPFLAPHPTALRRHALQLLGNTGGMFFVIQISVLLIFQTDNIIIAHFAGAAEVTPYSIAYRLFGYTVLIQNLIFPNLWPAYAEAIARNDIRWVKRTYRSNQLVSLVLTVVLAVPLIFVASPIIRVWAGDAALGTLPLYAWMASWYVIYAVMSAASCLLSASGRIKTQMIYALATAVANITATLILIGMWGITGVIAGTVIAYILCDIVPGLLDVEFLLKRLTRGQEGILRTGGPGPSSEMVAPVIESGRAP